MKSKTNLILLSLAALMASSCSKSYDDDYNPVMSIRFMPAVHSTVSQTRSVFPEQDSFTVWSFALDGGRWSEDGAKAREWIKGDNVTFTNGVWRNAQGTLWNEHTGSLTFFAYAPSSLPMDYDSSKGLNLKGFNVSENPTDILFTNPVMDVNKLECGGEVDIPFHHALCQVGMSIRSINTQEAELHIKSVTMDNVGFKGDFQTIPLGWTVTEDRESLEFCTEELVLGPEERMLGKRLCMPQSGYRPVTVTYDIYLRGEKFLKDQTITAVPVSTVWEPDKEYLYTLEMTLDKLTYKTDVIDN